MTMRGNVFALAMWVSPSVFAVCPGWQLCGGRVEDCCRDIWEREVPIILPMHVSKSLIEKWHSKVQIRCKRQTFKAWTSTALGTLCWFINWFEKLYYIFYVILEHWMSLVTKYIRQSFWFNIFSLYISSPVRLQWLE